MKRLNYLPLLLLVFSVVVFFKPYFANGKLPIPADTIIGLYHPFRDLYANDYPNGIPYKNFLITDPVRQQYPWRLLSIETIKDGSLPFWNPYSMAGTPLLANFQTAAFYPLNILFFILPFSVSWSVLVMLQPLLAGLFLYMYLRYMKLTTAAAALGGITCAFGGFSTAWLEWNSLLHVALWLPLILLALEHLFKKISYKWIAIFIFAQTAAFFAGHLQTFLYVFLLYNMYLFARIFQITKLETKKNKLVYAIKKYYPLLLSVGAAGIITAIQWIPTLQFINLSARGVDQINGWQQPGWFIPWPHLIQFIAPDFFGNPTTLNYWGEWNYGEFIGYIGILPLIMAIYALFNRQDKKTFFFGSLFFLSLVFSLPTFFAELPYRLEIPLLSTTQPTRLLFITDFSLAVLASLGLDYFIKALKKSKIMYTVGGVGIIFAGLWLYVLFGSDLIPFVTSENIAIAKRNLFIPTFFFLISALILAVMIFTSSFKRLDQMINRKLLGFLLIIFLLGITLFDLLRFSEKFLPFTDRNYLFPSTKSLAYLQDRDGQFRIMSADSRILPPNFSIMYRLQSIDGYDPLYLQRYGELMAALKRDKPDITSPFGFNRIITPQKVDSRLIDLLGVQYILSLTDIVSPKLEKVFSEGQTQIYRNNEAFPRAFFVENIQLATNKNESVQKLFDNRIDLKKTAIVEMNDRLVDAGKFENGTATITMYTPNKVTITTNNSEEGFLVLMDSYYPTWKAKVCYGEEEQCADAKIYITNYNFRGIVVPKGSNSIVFYNSLL